ncbi:MAG: C-GCAxxG-C-C family protein [Desulfocurvibacter africanus]
MSRIDVAVRAGELFESNGLLCAESVLQALCERNCAQAAWSGFAPRMASGFCSGVARTGGMCGALSGAIMALGLLHGRDSGQESLEAVYAMVQELVNEFQERFGAVTCAELTGVDFRTAEGQQAFRERNLKLGLCVPMARASAEMAQRLMDDFGADPASE